MILNLDIGTRSALAVMIRAKSDGVACMAPILAVCGPSATIYWRLLADRT